MGGGRREGTDRERGSGAEVQVGDPRPCLEVSLGSLVRLALRLGCSLSHALSLGFGGLWRNNKQEEERREGERGRGGDGVRE